MTDDDHGQHDEKHDEKRRAFLRGAGVAAGAGLVAGTGLAPGSLAQKASKRQPEAAAGHMADHMHTPPGGLGAFFNEDEAAAVAAFTERLMPGAPDKPGALDCGVLNYIDLALAGAYADQQDYYRRGLAGLEAYCRKAHNRPFARLTPEQQDAAITAMEQGKAGEFGWPSGQALFATLRTHTMEGMFADPVYGGNKNFAGWRLVGFPGAQPTYTSEDLASTRAFTRAPAIGLQGQASAPARSNTRKG